MRTAVGWETHREGVARLLESYAAVPGDAPVRLANRELFRVVAPAVIDRQNPGTQMPVEWRAETIEDSLTELLKLADAGPLIRRNGVGWEVYRSAYDPQTLRVNVARLNNQLILTAADADHPQPLTLLTVTDLDARYYNLTAEALAERWRETLQTTLVDALLQRQPDVLRQQAQRALWMALGMAGTSLLLWLLWLLLHHRHRQLAACHPQGSKAGTVVAVTHEDESMAGRRQFLAGLRSQFKRERRLSLVGLGLWLTVWGQVVVWGVGVLWIYALFPATAPLVEVLSTRLLSLLLIWFTVGLLNRVGNIAIGRLARAWEDNHFLLEDDQRCSLRIPTIVRSLKGCKTAAVYLLGLGWALNVLGVSLNSVLTLSAILALAISFASQSLVKDLVNGFLILLEDQYAIGDYVTLGKVSGLVENLNLRITQLRDVEGRLITVPNSQITLVENWTRVWSRVDFSVTLAYDTNVKQALSLIEAVAQTLAVDPVWSGKLLEPPQMLGIDRASHEGIVIRVWLITKPMQQFEVRREMTRRVWLALEEAQIEVGRPQQVMWHHTAADFSSSLPPELPRLIH